MLLRLLWSLGLPGISPFISQLSAEILKSVGPRSDNLYALAFNEVFLKKNLKSFIFLSDIQHEEF